MPITIRDPHSSSSLDIKAVVAADGKYSREYRERYPLGKNLKPGSELHDKLVSAIMERANDSERFMTPKHTTWACLDHMLTGYIDWDENERRIRDKDSRKPVSIVVPESYAVLETLLTYMLAAFGEYPTLGYEPVGPEDRIGTILLELIVDSQIRNGRALLDLHTMWRDAFVYGIGPVFCGWEVEEGHRSGFAPQGYYLPDGRFVQTGWDRVRYETVLFEGTKLYPIDPYYYLPDPAVNLHEPQKGEYVGWKEEDTYVKLREKELESGSIYFNVQFLKNATATSSVYKTDPSGRNEGLPTTERGGSQALCSQRVDVIYMCWNLIPKDWGLGKGERPEKWFFGVAGDEVLIAAGPMELDHNKFPVAVCAPDFDGHAIMPVSKIEQTFGLQEVANFYQNSHVAEVRKALFNQFLVDPKLVNMKDVYAHSPVIRTKEIIWGRGVKDVMEQMPVYDATRNHMDDMERASLKMRHISGAVDSLQGLQRTRGERVTATEFQSTRMSALSRLQKAARIISLQAMHDIGLFYAYHTQQFMSQLAYVRTAGKWQEVLQTEYGITEAIPVTPFDLDVMFDVAVHDGSITGSEYSTDWVTLYSVLMKNPEAARRIDLTRVFLHIARLMGEKNIQDFLKKGAPMESEVLPDQQVGELAASGQLMPVEEAGV